MKTILIVNLEDLRSPHGDPPCMHDMLNLDAADKADLIIFGPTNEVWKDRNGNMGKTLAAEITARVNFTVETTQLPRIPKA